MTRVQRFDRSNPVGKITATPIGGIRVDGALTASDVFLYRLSDGSTQAEYRPPEEVFAPDSLASLRAAPVTDMHPEEPVTADSWHRDSVGHVGDDVHAEDPYVVAGVVVQDAQAVAKVNARDRVELSCGYSCGLEMTPGVAPSGKRYDAIQRDIRYNHVALLPKGEGRGGPNVRLRLDAGACISSGMRTHRIDGVDYEAGTDSHIAAADKIIGSTLARAIAAEKRADTAEARVKELEAKSSPEAIRTAARDRARLLSLVDRFKVDTKAERIDDTSADDAIIVAILKKAMPGVDFGKLMLSHEQLMAFLAQVVGADAGAPPPDAPPPADGAAPPAPPSPGAGPADSITRVRDLPPDPKNVPGRADADDPQARIEAARAKNATRAIDSMRRKDR